jgi:DNA topoisomerase-1
MYFKTQLNKPIKYNSIESTVFVKNKHSHYTEASLINKLEDIGIGRPSTFSTIVTTILDRGYVNKTNIDGMKVNCIDYILNDSNISENKEERIFGNEKNKLVIQPIGILTIEFLMKYYNELFSYEYTKNMEDKLDIITNNDNDWSNICRECYNDIKNMTKSIKIEKQTYPLDDKHVLLFEKYGPVIQYVNDKNEYEYISVKKDFPIDLEKLKNKEYTLDELIEIKEHVIGSYKNNNVVIKNGRYGKYLECGDTRESLKNLEKDITEIKMEDIFNILEKTNDKSQDINLLRIINDNISIRKGKFGIYVFYKTSQMKKPKFLNIKKFKEGPLTCDANILLNWLHDTYDIEIS